MEVTLLVFSVWVKSSGTGSSVSLKSCSDGIMSSEAGRSSGGDGEREDRADGTSVGGGEGKCGVAI